MSLCEPLHPSLYCAGRGLGPVCGHRWQADHRAEPSGRLASSSRSLPSALKTSYPILIQIMHNLARQMQHCVFDMCCCAYVGLICGPCPAGCSTEMPFAAVLSCWPAPSIGKQALQVEHRILRLRYRCKHELDVCCGCAVQRATGEGHSRYSEGCHPLRCVASFEAKH